MSRTPKEGQVWALKSDGRLMVKDDFGLNTGALYWFVVGEQRDSRASAPYLILWLDEVTYVGEL